MRAFAELSEDGKRIEVHFPYNPDAVIAVKRVPGARFVPKDKGGPHWTVPLNLQSGRALRNEFGVGLNLGDAIRAWGRDEIDRQRNLATLAMADDAELELLPKTHPLLARAIAGEALPELGLPPKHPLSRARAARPYQRADIAMMSKANVLNGNQPGTGKTIETIGSWIESGLIDQGPHLVIAPVKSLENVWEEEIDRWLDNELYTAEDTRARKVMVESGLDEIDKGNPVIIAINFDMIRLVKIADHKDDEALARVREMPKEEIARRDYKGNVYGWRNDIQRRLLQTEWATVTIDEFHKAGLPNNLSLFALSVAMLKAKRKSALSGTPMGGKPRRLWGTLHWLEPDTYSSFWQWAEHHLVIDDNGFGKTVGGIKPEHDEEFYHAHAHHLVRRLKREALPGLPPKAEILVMSRMTPKQEAQYKKFADELEIRIEDERLAAQNVLSEYTRLKQFANAAQTMVDGSPFPTADSGKLADLVEKLDEEGIRKTDPEPGARAIIASESKRMVDMVAAHLSSIGIDVGVLTGDTKDTKSIIKRFKDGKGAYCIVMTIQTGGVSLNLEEAGSMHALDETWNPDDMEQFFDRGDRGSRAEPLRCYTYRTRNTIQEYIGEINFEKAITNKNILDMRSQIKAMRDDN